jgi:hypothetical protein
VLSSMLAEVRANYPYHLMLRLFVKQSEHEHFLIARMS